MSTTALTMFPSRPPAKNARLPALTAAMLLRGDERDSVDHWPWASGTTTAKSASRMWGRAKGFMRLLRMRDASLAEPNLEPVREVRGRATRDRIAVPRLEAPGLPHGDRHRASRRRVRRQ